MLVVLLGQIILINCSDPTSSTLLKTFKFEFRSTVIPNYFGDSANVDF
jgi:hypothetical protein